MLGKNEEKISKQFCGFCISVLRNAARDIQRSEKRMLRSEKSLQELTTGELMQATACDEYFAEHIFRLYGNEIVVMGDELAEAIQQLPPDKRDLILMSYFMGMSDAEIGRKLNIIQQTIFKRRTSILKQLRNLLSREDFEL